VTYFAPWHSILSRLQGFSYIAIAHDVENTVLLQCVALRLYTARLPKMRDVDASRARGADGRADGDGDAFQRTIPAVAALARKLPRMRVWNGDDK
jgi:hypothetical protein